MEERIIDKDEARKIKLKRTQEGETDAVDALAEGEDEVEFEFPEDGEYDEDLVGLTPSQLKEELERRERALREAKEECAKLLTEGKALLKKGNFEEAETVFGQATVYDMENVEAMEGLWTARTRDFTTVEPLYDMAIAEELASDEAARKLVCTRLGKQMTAAREEYASEEEKLRPAVEGKQAERREAFVANRKYYLIRFGAALAALVLFLIGVGVSADHILRTQSITPIVLTVVFGVLSFVALVVLFVFSRKLIVAARLCSENEKYSSTEDGQRLAFLQERLYILKEILEGDAE